MRSSHIPFEPMMPFVTVESRHRVSPANSNILSRLKRHGKRDLYQTQGPSRIPGFWKDVVCRSPNFCPEGKKTRTIELIKFYVIQKSRGHCYPCSALISL